MIACINVLSNAYSNVDKIIHYPDSMKMSISQAE